jgi:hypothetical protein
VADGDGLENHCGGNVTVGSNPTPSALTSVNRPELGLCLPTPCRRFVTDRSQMQPTIAICRWSREASTYGVTISPSNSIAVNGDPGAGGGSIGWYSAGWEPCGGDYAI